MIHLRLIRRLLASLAIALFASCSTPPKAESQAGASTTVASDSSGAPTYATREVDEPPVAMVRVPLRPPPTLRRAAGGANAIVAFVVDTTGKPRDVHAISSSDPDFATAAEDAVRQWRFKPGYRNGEPVNTSMQMPMNFQGN